jgi:4-carboxymuconolactone decarboxylase
VYTTAAEQPEDTMPAKTPAKTTRTKQMPPRLPPIPPEKLTPEQKALIDSIRSGPRGEFKMSGPFFCYLHAPAFGELAQRLGAHCRLGTSIPPRLSEFAILVTARLWKSQYEWAAHAAIAESRGVAPQTIRDLRVGRTPKRLPKDEKAVYTFIRELYRDKRVSDRSYAAVQALLGDAGTVELVGLLGYYATVAMILDVFRMPAPEGQPLPFREPTAS